MDISAAIKSVPVLIENQKIFVRRRVVLSGYANLTFKDCTFVYPNGFAEQLGIGSGVHFIGCYFTEGGLREVTA